MHRILFFHQKLPDLTWPEGRDHIVAYLTDSDFWKFLDPGCLQSPGSSPAEGDDDDDYCEQNQACVLLCGISPKL